MTLTDRDLDLLETLSRRASPLSFHQVAQIWWPEIRTVHTARRRLDGLVQGGWIDRHVLQAMPSDAVVLPLFAWRPGQCAPDSASLANTLRDRKQLVLIPTAVYTASSCAAGLLGSAAYGLPSIERRAHALRLASIYVHYRQNRPRLAACWLRQQAQPKAGYRVKDADVVLQDAGGHTFAVIKSPGRWTHEQVEAFHQQHAELDLPYEIW